MGKLIGGARPDTSDVPVEASDKERMQALVGILSDYVEHYHGGSIELVEFDGKCLRVRMGGACVGCDLSPHLLDGWIADTVRPFFPGLETVEAVE
jgi:Fe-S cluster biogenesis protein NfuA